MLRWGLRLDDSVASDVTEARQITAIGVSDGFSISSDTDGSGPRLHARGPSLDDRAIRGLSARAWRTLFSSDEKILGKTIRLASGGPVVVVGVARDTFDAPHDTDVWVAADFPLNIGHLHDAYIRLRARHKARNRSGDCSDQCGSRSPRSIPIR